MPMDDWRMKLAKALKTVKDGTGELYQTTKINVDLGREQDNLKKIYYDIGKKVHEIYQYGGSLGKFFDEKYLEIKEVEEKIEALQKKMEELKKVRVCIHCGKEVESKAKCGSPMDDTVKEEKNTKETIKEEENRSPQLDIKVCPNCKAENQKDDKFCLSCGRTLV
ncbi:MAG TPA: zinc ribbon domain-containing protein [Defluviitaleaceae bacterium]|nr:zinc ribbon domain-containing protein [Defluviitaleaceae bacterium]